MTPVFGSVHNSSDGRIYTKRISRIDLSIADYGGANGVFYNGLDRKKGSACNGYCSKYPVYTTYASYAAASGNRIGLSEDGTIYYVDSNYSDAASFKQSLQGVYLYYELETPETYNLVDYASTEDVITDKWANWKIYAVGDYCIYQNQLYRCITQCQGVLPTDSNYFVQTSVSKEFINITNTTMITLNNSVDIPVSTLIKTIIISRGADHVGTVYLCDYWNVYKIAGTDIVQISKQGNIVTITNNNPQYGSIFVRVI